MNSLQKYNNTVVAQIVETDLNAIISNPNYENKDLKIMKESLDTNIKNSILALSVELDNELKAKMIIAEQIKKALNSVLQDYAGLKKPENINEYVLIMSNQFSDFSIKEIKQAFRLQAKTGVETRQFGTGFNCSLFIRILKAYQDYKNEVLPRLSKSELIAANRLKNGELERRQQQDQAAKKERIKVEYTIEMFKQILESYACLKVGLTSVEISPNWIKFLSKKMSLVNFSDLEKSEMKKQAIELTKVEMQQTVNSKKFNPLFNKSFLNAKEQLKKGFVESSIQDKVTRNICKIGFIKWCESLGKTSPIELQENLKGRTVLKGILTPEQMTQINIDFTHIYELERFKKVATDEELLKAFCDKHKEDFAKFIKKATKAIETKASDSTQESIFKLLASIIKQSRIIQDVFIILDRILDNIKQDQATQF